MSLDFGPGFFHSHHVLYFWSVLPQPSAAYVCWHRRQGETGQLCMYDGATTHHHLLAKPVA